MGEKNTLQLMLEGQIVTASINGAEVARLRAQAPGVPSHIGLVAASASDATGWQLSDLKITNVPVSLAGPPAAAADVAALAQSRPPTAARARRCWMTPSRSTIRRGDRRMTGLR